jgi:hypothetical protein
MKVTLHIHHTPTLLSNEVRSTTWMDNIWDMSYQHHFFGGYNSGCSVMRFQRVTLSRIKVCQCKLRKQDFKECLWKMQCIMRGGFSFILQYLHFAMVWISYQKLWYWIVISIIDFLKCVMFVGQSADNEVLFFQIKFLYPCKELDVAKSLLVS